MSSISNTTANPFVDSTDAPAGGVQPGHHRHTGNESLLDGRGTGASTRSTSGYDQQPAALRDTVPHDPQQPKQHGGLSNQSAYSDAGADGGATAYNSERPLSVRPTQTGGVAVDGRDNLPLGKANMGDKIIGKTEKVVGKMTNNPEMHEKGELRETGGKDAAYGYARAAHD